MTDANVLDISGRIIDLGGHTISAKDFTFDFPRIRLHNPKWKI